MTSFGAILLIEPHPIDFHKVLVEFQQIPETGNIAVVVAMAVILVWYVSTLVIVRKFDKEDAKNVSIEPDFVWDRSFNGVYPPVHCVTVSSQDLILNSDLQLLHIFLCK